MRALFLISCLLISIPGFSQQNYKNDLRFLDYLLRNNFSADVEKYLLLNKTGGDSLYYLTGKYFFSIHRFDTASVCFSKVSGSSPMGERAVVNKNYALVFNKSSPVFGDRSSCKSDTALSLLQLCFSGYHALRRDTSLFHSSLKASDKLLQEENEGLESIMKDLQAYRPKSPVVTGVLSAIIPGAGKVYAGRTWQGLGAFVMVSALAFGAWEGYHHTGFQSPQFYIFGSVGAVFYIGNIWGSVSEVKLQARQINDAADAEIYNNLLHAVNRFGY